MVAFGFQLDNLFAVSKVIHTIRSITDWLDVAEDRAFQVMSIYEMSTQIPDILGTIEDNRKALEICSYLLKHLGSVYHRIQRIRRPDVVYARVLIDMPSSKYPVGLKANQCCIIRSNRNPHLWLLEGYPHAVPSLFLEASTEFGELQILERLRGRFDEFLIMCHGRCRRQLYAKLKKQSKCLKSLTTPNLQPMDKAYLTAFQWDGHYFARSPYPTKRWRWFYNSKLLCRQPTSFLCATADDIISASTVSHMMERLRRWLHFLPPPADILENVNKHFNGSCKMRCCIDSFEVENAEVEEVVNRWWNIASLYVPNANALDRIVNEARFLKVSALLFSHTQTFMFSDCKAISLLAIRYH
ncbi:unnamed protein product [Dicrocoelium dendriticum]|nr:unnamed protein product [Dicrocoelium dendriticum]